MGKIFLLSLKRFLIYIQFLSNRFHLHWGGTKKREKERKKEKKKEKKKRNRRTERTERGDRILPLYLYHL